MRIIITILVLILNLSLCKAQNPKGVWMSYDNYIINFDNAGRSYEEGILIDFDNKMMGHIRKDTMIGIDIDFERKNIGIETDTLIHLNYQFKNMDSLEFDFGLNVMEIFKPLNLKHKLKITKSKISEFLIENDFKPIDGEMKVEFSKEDFYQDLDIEKPDRRKTLINHTLNTKGYWYLREIKDNFFLIFTIEYIPDIHIFQILEVNECNLRLNQIILPGIVNYFKNDIKELRTCL